MGGPHYVCPLMDMWFASTFWRVWIMLFMSSIFVSGFFGFQSCLWDPSMSPWLLTVRPFSLLSHGPRYGHTTVSLSILLLMGFRVVSSFWLITDGAMSVPEYVFGECICTFLSDIYLGEELLGHRACVCVISLFTSYCHLRLFLLKTFCKPIF